MTRGAKIEVRCQNGKCCKKFEARVVDRKRGWGKYCSKTCKAVEQEQRTGQMGNYLVRQYSRYSSDSNDIENTFHPHDGYSLGQW